MNPLVAIALGALLLDEQLTLAVGVGAAMIVGSVFVAVRQENAASRRRSLATAGATGTPADQTV